MIMTLAQAEAPASHLTDFDRLVRVANVRNDNGFYIRFLPA